MQNSALACCFYGCKTWSLTLRKEPRCEWFEKVLREQIRSKREGKQEIGKVIE
jgi:hypothetical protein